MLFCDADVQTPPKTVNNVGVSHEFPSDFVDTSPEELATIINVNVTATLRITSLIAPAMASRCVSLSCAP
jgi:short-subunit dehydrogenase